MLDVTVSIAIRPIQTPRGTTKRSMTIKQQLHQLLEELDEDSVREALAYLQSRHERSGSGGVRTDDVTAAEAEHAAAMEAWEDEGGGQAGQAVDERSREPSRGRSPVPVKADLDQLIAALDHESAVQVLTYLQSLRRPRLLSEAEIDEEPGTEEERESAMEAWQLDRRHALDER
jgi:hypothetical protein